MEPGPSGTSKASAQTSGQSDTDITAEFLQPLLTPDNVANLVRLAGGVPTKGGRISVLSLPPLHSAHLLQVASVPKHLCSQCWEGVGLWALLTLDGPPTGHWSPQVTLLGGLSPHPHPPTLSLSSPLKSGRVC